MTTWQHGFVTAGDGTRLAVSTTGPADAPVRIVFSHGLALSQQVWAPQCRHLIHTLGRSTQLVIYDQRGHGRSQEPVDTALGYSIATLGADLADVIAHTCPGDSPIMVVGHSLGGMAILALAHHHPQVAAHLTSAALISTAAHRLSEAGIGRALNSPAVAVLERFATHSPRLTHHAWRLARATLGPLLGIPVTRGEHAADMASIRAVAGLLAALRTHDESAGLRALRSLPSCLVACGDADPVTPLRHSLRLCQELPQARLLTAARAGHMLPLDRPRLISDALATLATAALASARATAC